MQCLLFAVTIGSIQFKVTETWQCSFRTMLNHKRLVTRILTFYVHNLQVLNLTFSIMLYYNIIQGILSFYIFQKSSWKELSGFLYLPFSSLPLCNGIPVGTVLNISAMAILLLLGMLFGCKC